MNIFLRMLLILLLLLSTVITLPPKATPESATSLSITPPAASSEMAQGGTSGVADPFLEELIAQLFDNFFRSLKSAAKTVLEGSSISLEDLKRILSHHIESIRVMVDDARIAQLVQLTEQFATDVLELQDLSRSDLTPQIETELRRLQDLAQQERETAAKQLAEIDADLTRIEGNIMMTAQQTRHTAEQAELHRRNIQSAEEMIKKAQALHRKSTDALDMERKSLEVLSTMSSQLQKEAETRTEERATLELQMAQRLSLDESRLRDQAVATATVNYRMQLAAKRTALVRYTKPNL